MDAGTFPEQRAPRPGDVGGEVMARSRTRVVLVSAVLLGGCGERNHAEGLEAPPTAGVPTAGPGSGDTIAAHLHYVMQTNNPEILFEHPSCPDVKEVEPGTTVTCEMAVDGEPPQKFLLTMDDEGFWQISDG
jgi:hypothetical protein